MAGSIQRAVKLDERKNFLDPKSCPVVQSDKQQRLEGNARVSVKRKAALHAEAVERLAKRRATEGSAGGFFDRQDANDRVEYDSDQDSIDDFGRRRKRAKRSNMQQQAKATESRSAATSADSSATDREMQTNSLQKCQGTGDLLLADNKQMEGIVRWFESSKGFGFLKAPGIDADIYFKDQDRSLSPVEGTRVTFHLKITPDGKPQARGIARAGPALPAQKANGTEPHMTLPAQGMTSACAPTSGNEALMMQAHMMMQMQMGSLPGAAPGGWPAFAEHMASIASQSSAHSDVEAAGTCWDESEAPQIHKASADRSSMLEKGFNVGRVKSYNSQKGFGFIQSTAVEGDIYFKGIFPDFQGRQVSFKLNMKGGRAQANCIEVLD